MKPTVYVVSHNGSSISETFDNDTDATNYAKNRSKSSFCTIYHTANNKMFIYENEELVNEGRRNDLAKTVEQMIVENMQREVKQANKKR
jgi:hypothetical protein